jgi:hypothetical protein
MPSRTPPSSYKRKLWGGYEISLGPTRNGYEGVEDAGCTAAIYNAAGKVVFRTTGFGVIFDEGITGEDVDGDGKPDIVFRTDEAGGAHCCWIYNVVSLSPRPHKLFDVGQGGAVRFEKDANGKMTIWERVGGTTGYTSEAGRPYAERVYRVRAGKLLDITPEFCGKIFSPGNQDFDEWSHVLTAQNISRLQSSNFGSTVDFEIEGVVSALLSRAQQYVFCHQYEEALADLNLWPEASRNEVKRNFAQSIKDYSPAFAAQLTGAPAK